MSRTGILEDGLLACEDCAIAIANDDYTGMDDTTETRIRLAVRQLSKRGFPVVGDEVGFTWRGCDCCHDGMGGTKYALVLLGEVAR